VTVSASLRRLDAEVGELVSRHERAKDLSEFTHWQNDPVGFIRDVLSGEPWKRQIEIAESVRDSPLVVVRSANAVGKDWIAARLALWWVYCRRGLALVTGPTERQVREVVMGEVARAFHAAKDLPGELYQMALRLGSAEQAGILAFTSTEASRLTGFHAPRVLAVLTEAQGVEEFAWEGLLACVTGSEDRVLAVGNPLSPSGRFYSVSRSRNWKPIRISAEEHPNLLNGKEPIPGGPSREFMQRIASEFGEGSGIYRARVLGDFPDEGEEGLIRRSWLEEAAERFDRREFRLESARAVPIVAVDPARYGPDYTVLAVRRGPVPQKIVSWGQVSTMETVGRLQTELRRVGVLPDGSGYVIVDEVGLGAGVLDRLKEIGYRYHAYPFNGGRRAHDQPRFLNARAESYWHLRQKLEAGEIALPRDEMLFDELVATRWRPTSDGRVQIEGKDDLKARLGRSPDRADAVAMAFYRFAAGGREPGDHGITI